MDLNQFPQESLEREFRIDRKTDGVLYHYTNLHALYAIISTGLVWGTRSEFLNDFSELKYIKKVIEDVTDSIEEDAPERSFKEAVLKNLNGIYFNTHHPSKCYLLSLTDISDLITNWSTYSNFDGYNIGLDATGLHQILEHRYSNHFISGYVIYDKELQEDIIKEEFEHYLRQWKAFYPGAIEDQSRIAELFMFRILIYSYFFKHPSFKQEEEYRIAFFPENFAEGQKAEVKFRPSNGVIIPYIELNLKDITGDRTNLPLKEVWIGPMNKMDNAFLGIDSFLSSLGYDTETPDGTRIMTSVIPLRF